MPEKKREVKLLLNKTWEKSPISFCLSPIPNISADFLKLSFLSFYFVASMISKLLVFRFRQLLRMLRGIGVVYLILVFVLLFGGIMGAIEQLVKSDAPALGLLGIFFVFFIHLNRKDIGFLSKLDIFTPKLFAAEYLISLLPLSLTFIFSENYGAAILQNAGLILISFIKPISGFSGGFSSRLDFKMLFRQAFEARSYLRQFVIPLGLVYVFLLGTAMFVAPAILAAFFIAITFAAFFDEVESKELFEVFHFKKGILTSKIQTYLGLYFSLMIPHILLFLVLHFEYWYLLLAALFFGSTVILFNIFYRYAQFTPYRRRVYNSTANSFFIFSILVPFFYPVTLVYLLIYWRRARKNIQFYYAKNK